MILHVDHNIVNYNFVDFTLLRNWFYLQNKSKFNAIGLFYLSIYKNKPWFVEKLVHKKVIIDII